MRKSLILTCLLVFSLLLRSQTPVGSWSDNLVYNSARNVVVGSKEVFVSTGSSLMVYNKEYAELKKLSRVTGLTETGISTIAWSDEYEILVIAYSSTNVDLLVKNTIYNIPDIARKYIPGKKEINRIRIQGKYAYLSCSFGIVLIDMLKREIYDTWKPGNGTSEVEVRDIAFGNGVVYAATSSGLYSADAGNQGLAYFGNWSLVQSLPFPNAYYSQVLFAGNRLYVNRAGTGSSGDYIYVISSGCSLFSNSPGVLNRSFDSGETGFSVSSGSSVRFYRNDGSLERTVLTYGWGTPDASQAAAENSNIWIADKGSGLVKSSNMTDFESLTLPGPASNQAISLTSHNGKTIICGGGVDPTWNNLWRPLQLSVNENNIWTNFTANNIYDPVKAFIDPGNNNHFFVATWGAGLLEYEDNILKKQYNDSNSPLQTIITGKQYVRVGGLAMDNDRNLWITQTEVPGSIKILKPDGTWIVNPVTINAPTIGDIVITRNGLKWVVLPRGHGLFVLDDKNTPENSSDDISVQMLVTDTEDKVISYVYCIAEDLDGNIWVGTDQGPVIYYNPDKVLESDIKAYRIKIPRNDGSGLADYMLGTESITSIAVDGANRKWLGTLSSGAYLLSPDGTEKFKNFNVENSPIFSNTIAGIAIDNKSGNVWFATSNGTVSFRGDATEGNNRFAGVYSFPNPVREDFDGNVTITGLMKDTRIRITDVSGNLVYKTESAGGQASWDLSTYNGSRVATGVYIVFCASSDGKQSSVTKILVIN